MRKVVMDYVYFRDATIQQSLRSFGYDFALTRIDSAKADSLVVYK
jgi:hypothetical protein